MFSLMEFGIIAREREKAPKHANMSYITYSSSICERNIWCCRCRRNIGKLGISYRIWMKIDVLQWIAAIHSAHGQSCRQFIVANSWTMVQVKSKISNYKYYYLPSSLGIASKRSKKFERKRKQIKIKSDLVEFGWLSL